MNLVGSRFPCLTQLPVTLEGGWSPLPRRDWRGIAVASEPLVAVALLGSCGLVQWGRSERGSAEQLAVRLALLPYGADGLNVQVNFSVGLGGGRWQSVFPSFGCVPVILDRRELRQALLSGLPSCRQNRALSFRCSWWLDATYSLRETVSGTSARPWRL